MTQEIKFMAMQGGFKHLGRESQQQLSLHLLI